MTKQQRIMDYFTAHPKANVKHVATRFRTALPTIYALRKRALMQPKAPTPTAPEPTPVEILTLSEEFEARAVQMGGDHYKAMGVEPWDVVDTWPLEQRIGFYRGNALKYIMRMGSKDESPVEAAKGQHYLQKLLETYASASNNAPASTPPAPLTW